MANSGFERWHDFYALTGSASATLVGLMFVAASVGTGVFTSDRQVGLRTFLSPTVVAFSVVLGTSLVALSPLADGRAAALLLSGTGLLGMLYSWRVWRRMVQGGIVASIDLEDRVWYATVPAAAHALLAVAGGTLLARPDTGGTLVAGSIALLLIGGIRNAWDMTTWVVLRRRD